MSIQALRALRHLCTPALLAQRRFPAAARRAIEAAVQQWERRHPGEIRVVIEAALPFDWAVRGLSPRERALAVFAEQRVWDTEHNNGVLLYLLLADRAVEIVADRGVASGNWAQCCTQVVERLRAGQHTEGVVAGIQAIAAELAHFPSGPADIGNELPDAPSLI